MRRRITVGMHERLGKPDTKEVEKLKTIPDNLAVYGVIRTKGSSGERHVVNKLAEELLSKGKKVFICTNQEISSNDLIFETCIPSKVAKLISLDDIVTSHHGGVLSIYWRDISNLNKLFEKLSRIDNCALILTIGQDTGGKIASRVNQIIPFCKKIYLSVTSDCLNSTGPAITLCLDPEIDARNITLCWWHKLKAEDQEGDIHLIKLYSGDDLIHEITRSFNQEVVSEMTKDTLLD